MKPAIRNKRSGMLTNGVVLYHNNARPHIATANVETIRKLKFEFLLHPAYSIHRVPSVNLTRIFGPIKDALRGRRCADDEELKDAVRTWLCA